MSVRISRSLATSAVVLACAVAFFCVATAEDIEEASYVPTPAAECDTPHGTILGIAFHEPVRSNCREGEVSTEYNFVHFELSAKSLSVPRRATMPKPEVIRTGLKWQCVEFARRVLFRVRRAVFDDVESAHDLFDHGTVTEASDNSTALHMMQLVNKETTLVPRAVDFVIWAKQKGFPAGHVAVVTHVDTNTGSVLIAEQNYQHTPWTTRNHSRVLKFRNNGAGTPVELVDPAGHEIRGWLRVRPHSNHPKVEAPGGAEL